MVKTYIKNMVCPRCIESVKNIFEKEEVEVIYIKLGEIISKEINEETFNKLEIKLNEKGFEILKRKNSILIQKVKTLVLSYLNNSNENKIKLSEILSSELRYDYSYISRLFSSSLGYTIERYYTTQRIEKVKELLIYDELNLNEISYKLNFSSISHLSNQFKQITGMSPTEFKNQHIISRRFVDEL
ncbi:MAG: AraC family transcriptional regulator [Flavobacteriaceae bacterium]|nr:AraC family transcriptional regulator [Flavobacteriaceae bacterium]